MSELINNSKEKKAKLKELILKIHDGVDEALVRKELMETLSSIPYEDVVSVEQELIEGGLPVSEILRLCDVHSAVLQGNIDLQGARKVADGHPIDIMLKENIELNKIVAEASSLVENLEKMDEDTLKETILALRGMFNLLFDVDKHYLRLEYLVFPFLEKAGITGPPQVLWGKHDEIRDLIKGSIEILLTDKISKEELIASAEIVIAPALFGIKDMVVKEEEILFPMALDKILEKEWYQISKQSLEFGFCLYDPPMDWKPEWVTKEDVNESNKTGSHVQLPSGGFTVEELLSILNTLPLDMTFVDKDDKVKYFSQGADRIFARNRAILNRDVRHCHPPGSVHIVNKIIEDFKTGKQNRAPFWINKGGKFIHIEYFALRNENGEYLGTLEVSHDITNFRALEGEQRLLSYK